MERMRKNHDWPDDVMGHALIQAGNAIRRDFDWLELAYPEMSARFQRDAVKLVQAGRRLRAKARSPK